MKLWTGLNQQNIYTYTYTYTYTYIHGFPGSSAAKKSTCNAGDPGSIPGWERSTGEDRLPIPEFSIFPGGRHKKIHLQCKTPGFNPWVGKVPWRRTWKPTPVVLPGESPWTEETGSYSPWGCRVRQDLVTKHRTAHTYVCLPRWLSEKESTYQWAQSLG